MMITTTTKRRIQQSYELSQLSSDEQTPSFLTKQHHSKRQRQRRPATVTVLSFCLLSLSLLLMHFNVFPDVMYEESLRRNDDSGAPPPSLSHHDDHPNIHMVFSTSCNRHQEWQSYVFFYHAMKTNQPGTITRIASGCSDVARMTVSKLFEERIRPMSPSRFHLHFTPDYSNNKYVYFNKPFGIQHWIDAQREQLRDDDIIVIMDPDMLLLRPFSNVYRMDDEVWYHDNNTTTTQQPFTVTHGSPLAQSYELWYDWDVKFPNMSHITKNDSSPVQSLSQDDIRQYYRYGPPYIATARDMTTIVSTWTDFVPRVYNQYPELLAEMYAYVLAAAHLQLPHTTVKSFMLSNVVDSDDSEAWSVVDSVSSSSHMMRPHVHTIHYCQDYQLDDYYFYKSNLPANFFSCRAPLLKELDETAVQVNAPVSRRRQAFVLSTLIPALNEAATYWKRNHCSDNNTIVNYNKTKIIKPTKF